MFTPVREDFNEVAGSIGDHMVRAIVTQRESDETRSPYVVLEDVSSSEALWLPWGQAGLLASFLAGQGMGNEEGFALDDRMEVRVADNGSTITLIAHDPRQGQVSVPRAISSDLAELVERAAAAVGAIEDLDAM